MVEHRKNVARTSYVPSSWFIVLTVMLCVGGAGWIGWLLVDGGSSDPSAAPRPSASTSASAPASASPEPTRTTPKPTPSRTTPTVEEPQVERTVQVSVLNNTGITGAARAYTAKVSQAGWPIGGIGNWNGSIGANTVYFPAQLADEGKLLADDLGIDQVKPSFAPMRTDRLTVILSGPQ